MKSSSTFRSSAQVASATLRNSGPSVINRRGSPWASASRSSTRTTRSPGIDVATLIQRASRENTSMIVGARILRPSTRPSRTKSISQVSLRCVGSGDWTLWCAFEPLPPPPSDLQPQLAVDAMQTLMVQLPALPAKQAMQLPVAEASPLRDTLRELLSKLPVSIFHGVGAQARTTDPDQPTGTALAQAMGLFARSEPPLSWPATLPFFRDHVLQRHDIERQATVLPSPTVEGRLRYPDIADQVCHWAPTSAAFRNPMICSSVNRLFLISPCHHGGGLAGQLVQTSGITSPKRPPPVAADATASILVGGTSVIERGNEPSSCFALYLQQGTLVRRKRIPGSPRDHCEAATDFFRAMQEIFERRFRWTVRQVLAAAEEDEGECGAGTAANRGGRASHTEMKQRLDQLERFFKLLETRVPGTPPLSASLRANVEADTS